MPPLPGRWGPWRADAPEEAPERTAFWGAGVAVPASWGGAAGGGGRRSTPTRDARGDARAGAAASRRRRRLGGAAAPPPAPPLLAVRSSCMFFVGVFFLAALPTLSGIGGESARARCSSRSPPADDATTLRSGCGARWGSGGAGARPGNTVSLPARASGRGQGARGRGGRGGAEKKRCGGKKREGRSSARVVQKRWGGGRNWGARVEIAVGGYSEKAVSRSERRGVIQGAREDLRGEGLGSAALSLPPSLLAPLLSLALPRLQRTQRHRSIRHRSIRRAATPRHLTHAHTHTSPPTCRTRSRSARPPKRRR